MTEAHRGTISDFKEIHFLYTILVPRIKKFGADKTIVKYMQRLVTEAIRTQIKPTKPKREVTNITNSQNTKRTYGQPSEQLLPNRWPLSNLTRTEINMNTHKVNRHRNSDTKNRQQRTTTKQPPWNSCSHSSNTDQLPLSHRMKHIARPDPANRSLRVHVRSIFDKCPLITHNS